MEVGDKVITTGDFSSMGLAGVPFPEVGQDVRIIEKVCLPFIGECVFLEGFSRDIGFSVKGFRELDKEFVDDVIRNL